MNESSGRALGSDVAWLQSPDAGLKVQPEAITTGARVSLESSLGLHHTHLNVLTEPSIQL